MGTLATAKLQWQFMQDKDMMWREITVAKFGLAATMWYSQKGEVHMGSAF